jgi:hypothetical protein
MELIQIAATDPILRRDLHHGFATKQGQDRLHPMLALRGHGGASPDIEILPPRMVRNRVYCVSQNA